MFCWLLDLRFTKFRAMFEGLARRLESLCRIADVEGDQRYLSSQ